MSTSPMGSVHIVSPLAALAFGGVVVASRKGTPIHRLLGLAYVFASLLLDASALSIYDMTGRVDASARSP